MDDYGERVFELHFNECVEESIFISEDEMIEWFNELQETVNDASKSVWYRMQKVIAMLTA